MNLPGDWPTLPPQADAPRVVHSSLESLVIAGGGDSVHFVSLPNLVRLTVGAESNTTFIHRLMPCVISFLQHSCCRLTSLDLKFPSWDEESMCVLLELLPELDSLTILSGGLPGVDDMFRVLTSHLAATKDGDSGSRLEPKCLPRLKTAVINLAEAATPPQWAFVDGAFLDMVAMRGEHGLEVFHLCGQCDSGEAWSNLELDDRDRLDKMVKAGLLDNEDIILC